MAEDSKDERPVGRRIRLTPPPRVDAKARVTPATAFRPAAPGGGASHQGRVLKWLTLAAFVVLLSAAVAVFVVLPAWVEENPAAIGLTKDRPPQPAVEDQPVATAPEPPPSAVPEPTPDEPPPPVAAEAPRSIPAQQVARSEDRQGASPSENEAFVRAMSDGLTALDREDYAAARAALDRARRLDPESQETADGLARAEAGLRRDLIAEHRENALGLEAREAWRSAAEQYAAALEIDPTVSFAQDGRARSLDRAELSDHLDRHIADPGRLSADDVLQEASTLLARAAAIKAPGPRLRRQADELGRWVEAFSTPVRARLESDNLTEVVVYKVGRLGTFSERALDLRPGTYTVVGSRRGYRDVRRQLVIEPGQAPEPLRVRCEEKI